MRYESPRSAIGQCVVWHGHLLHEKALDSLRHRCGGLAGAHLCFLVSHQNTEIVRIEKGGEMIKKEPNKRKGRKNSLASSTTLNAVEKLMV